MSAGLYWTGLWFYEGKLGRAKLHGRERRLENAPTLIGVQLAEIEYVPEVAVRRCREKFDGWRDMRPAEIKAADALLRLLLPEGETQQ
jgi:hypothetical protein